MTSREMDVRSSGLHERKHNTPETWCWWYNNFAAVRSRGGRMGSAGSRRGLRVIDLHCHILPGIDDGSPSLEESIAMANLAVADGVTVAACTPHIYPGLYDNDACGIREARRALQSELDAREIALKLVDGADTHLVPEVLDGVHDGRIPTLNGSRYLLLEPPHHVAPPRFEHSVFALLAAGIVPILTHPERLTWVDRHYAEFKRLALRGVWMQLTAGALTGEFGRGPRHFGEKLLDDGLVHILATDAHGSTRRAPRLAAGRDAASKRVGAAEAENLVSIRPRGVLANTDPARLPPIPALAARPAKPAGFWHRFAQERPRA